MDIDFSWLGWLLPLVIGAALTFFFGWLDSTLKYRREKALRAETSASETAERQRSEAREHALEALALTTSLRDQVMPKPRTIGSEPDFGEVTGKSVDKDQLRRLADLGVLIPDALLRELIGSIGNLLTAASTAADACSWAETPNEIQLLAVNKLRNALGSYLRIEPIAESDVAWFKERSQGLAELWEQYIAETEAYLAERRAADSSG